MSKIGYWRGGSTRPISSAHWSQASRAPEVVDVEEAALQQVGAQALDLVVAEARRADVFHVEDRAAEEQRIGEADDDVVGLAVGLHLDADERQLAEADGEVVVGAGVVGAPALAAVFEAVAGVVAAAEVEAAVEVVARRPLRRLAAEAAVAAAADPDARTRLLFLAELGERSGGDGER